MSLGYVRLTEGVTVRRNWLVILSVIVAVIVAYKMLEPDYWDLVEANTRCANKHGSQAVCTEESREMSNWAFYLKYGKLW